MHLRDPVGVENRDASLEYAKQADRGKSAGMGKAIDVDDG
jgi:hypothetical protein